MIVYTASEFINVLKKAAEMPSLYIWGGWGYPLKRFYNSKGELIIDNRKRAINVGGYNAKRADMIYNAPDGTMAWD